LNFSYDDTLSTHRRALREGEWACVDAKCAYINADRVSICERCGKSKPRSKNRVGREIGKDAAEKSKGLFAAEDWACTKCGNVNWARRTACNICNAPKLGDLEVRTGYGGGYMDRQNVEYIEREDNEEFDEFGRKKKRRRVEKNDEVVEEDDEEEGNDADLDKYDLSADEFEVEALKAKIAAGTDSQSRCSSKYSLKYSVIVFVVQNSKMYFVVLFDFKL
ncbi:unnamed protein product, partial [Thelazia callipaeda]|uniref:Zinc finger Ran-binding domain-containing protein 2 n=1 Tax=Thelazia callipaeda TaxID=103827 RepID=A0A0N5CNV3_THECL